MSERPIKSIIIEGLVCGNFKGEMTGTSTYFPSYLVGFKCFLNSRCLLY